MEDLAKLFQLGDQEHKGFLIRRDMQRLEGELSLSADQLEAVFDSLDSESQGYLTLDKFLLGYSKFVVKNTFLRAFNLRSVCCRGEISWVIFMFLCLLCDFCN